MLDDCFLHDKDRLKHAEALALIRSNVRVRAGLETVCLTDAHHRVLAEDIIAKRSIPSVTNAAVDGYAYRHGEACEPLQICGEISAGASFDKALPSKAAVRIFTGAHLPKGADTVAMQEDCRLSVSRREVCVPQSLEKGANRRQKGEDIEQGEKALETGSWLRAQEITRLASLGLTQVACYAKLRVGLISTGNEIVRPGQASQPEQVFDSNHFLLHSLARLLPVTLLDYGIVKDEPEAVEAVLKQAAKEQDIVITTGGASRGEKDYVVETLKILGTQHLWQIAVKPGRPLSFGHIEEAAFCVLPGNPVAAFVCFLLYVRPVILRMCGAAWREPERYRLPAAFSVEKKKPDRREFYRGIVTHGADGVPVLEKFKRDGSGLISGLTAADGLIEVLEETTRISKGDILNFIPFSQFQV